MTKKLLGTALMAGALLLGFDSHNHQLCDGIVPENDMNIPVNHLEQTGITEEQFHDVIDQVEDHYDSIVSSMGGSLMIERRWDDGTVNAYAQRFGSTYKVSMFGGLARHPRITPDAFMVVVCHELGHHIGGAPKGRSFFGTSWASNEGQSDYFASLKCMRRVLENQDNVLALADVDVPSVVMDQCSANFATDNEIAICVRSSLAGRQLARFFMDLRELEVDPAFDTPDQNVVSDTDDKHPAHQCRLDTYYQGALCAVDFNEEVSQSQARTGTCHRNADYSDGLRPLCWYKPSRW